MDPIACVKLTHQPYGTAWTMGGADPMGQSTGHDGLPPGSRAERQQQSAQSNTAREKHRYQDDQSLDDQLWLRLDSHKVHDVEDSGDDEATDHRADWVAAAAEKRGAADHDGRDRVQ